MLTSFASTTTASTLAATAAAGPSAARTAARTAAAGAASTLSTSALSAHALILIGAILVRHADILTYRQATSRARTEVSAARACSILDQQY